jgi:hypothetical protein
VALCDGDFLRHAVDGGARRKYEDVDARLDHPAEEVEARLEVVLVVFPGVGIGFAHPDKGGEVKDG